MMQMNSVKLFYRIGGKEKFFNIYYCILMINLKFINNRSIFHFLMDFFGVDILKILTMDFIHVITISVFGGVLLHYATSYL